MLPVTAQPSRHAAGRRAALRRGGAALVACTTLLPALVRAHAGHGQAEGAPEPAAGPVPAMRPGRGAALTLSNGRQCPLVELLQGQATAVQLMFTGCGSTCLVQGALFAQVQARLQQQGGGGRLLSISIDPLGDHPAGLAQWLRKFDAKTASWDAGVPTPAGLGAVLQGFRFPGTADAMHHLNRAFLFDRRGAMFWATGVDPDAADIAGRLQRG